MALLACFQPRVMSGRAAATHDPDSVSLPLSYWSCISHHDPFAEWFRYLQFLRELIRGEDAPCCALGCVPLYLGVILMPPPPTPNLTVLG